MSQLLGVPYVVTEHTRVTNNFRSFAHRQLTLFGLKRAHGLIAVSRWHADEITHFVGKPPAVIPNIIRFEEYPLPPAYRETPEFQIGFLGGLNTPVKGLDVLLQAVAGLGGKFKLHIGGKGDLLESYKQQAKELQIGDKCIFYGGIPHGQVNAFLKDLHVFVSASRWETFGVAIAEALACGLPVVTTDSGGPRDFITPENGLIVPPDDPIKLREGLERMMKNYPQYNPRLISRQVREKFTTENFMNRIEAVYAEALNRIKR